MELGTITLSGVRDGTAYLPPGYFGVNNSPAHDVLLGDDTPMSLPIACFVARTAGRTVLLDAGLGPLKVAWQPESGGSLHLEGGDLPSGLSGLGLNPADIDLVLLSHLHLDHSGWIWQRGAPFFPNAIVRFGRADWDTFVEQGVPGADSAGLRELARLGKVELIDADGTVAPGISSLHTPGHTPGHQTYVVSSGGERALFLGDAVACPLQMQEPELEALADLDRALGVTTRSRILQELDDGDLVSGPHFPELRFGRVMIANGRRYWN
jgi:glyoxylase-like metal-dependent hydrolase (beta-lactamase superfamily II)